jgi:hypothetical protein
VNHFEGDAQRDRVKDHAYAAIAAAKYYGDRKKFTFETYVTIHQDLYADLSQYGEIISEEKRVRDLLQGIKDNSAAANAAKGTILATPTLRNSFDNAVAHLATTLQLNTSINDTRNVSLTGTYNGNNRGGHQGGDISTEVEGVVVVVAEAAIYIWVATHQSSGASYQKKTSKRFMKAEISRLNSALNKVLKEDAQLNLDMEFLP